MPPRLVSVGDDFNLPAAVNVVDENLPARLGATELSATYAGKGVETSKLDKTEAATSYARLGYPGVPGAATQFTGILEAGLSSTALQVISDSTGAGTTRWVYLIAQRLAAKYPSYHVQYREWSDATQDYTAPVIIQAAAGERHLNLAGTGYAISAFKSSYAITGDLDIRVRASFDSLGGENTLASRFGAGGARAWRFFLDGSGRPCFGWTTDGTTEVGPFTSNLTPAAAGVPTWYRVTLDVDNGAGGHTISFYTSPDGATWTLANELPRAVGATTVYGGTVGLQVGARGDTGAGANFPGDIYRVQLRNGINGPVVNPIRPEQFDTFFNAPLAGSPTLDVVNGVRSGAALTYFTDSVRGPKITPDYGTSLALLSCSHNDGLRRGVPYLADWDTLAGTIASRQPLANVAVLTQNPRKAPADQITEHAMRVAQLIGWARRKGHGYIDTYRAFNEDPRGLGTLVNADGIHPTDATGSPLWADTVEAFMKNRY